jgi:CheY-like chemotaxis protein
LPPSVRSRPLFIVAADDDADDRLLITDAFGECGHEVDLHLCSDGEEVIHYLRTLRPGGDPSRLPDAILLDLKMPRRDGHQTLHELRQCHELRPIPVVILTTSSDADEIRACYRQGATDYVVKPVRFDQLVRAFTALAAQLADLAQAGRAQQRRRRGGA